MEVDLPAGVPLQRRLVMNGLECCGAAGTACLVCGACVVTGSGLWGYVALDDDPCVSGALPAFADRQ